MIFLTAEDAVREGLADALVPSGADPVEWLAGWIGGRSTLALDEAAALIRGRGGDVTERFAFARLFATGEPQEGLAAFLEKRRPNWNREMDLT
jgi:enoyl-CoA hydratase/carnithine racemase